MPKDNEVLIKVRVASVNPLDWRLILGQPGLIRVVGKVLGMTGRAGADAAGEVEAVGSKVTQFKPGDEVFGACRGAFAEYVCTTEPKIALKPVNVSFEDAASINVAGLTALQGLRDKGKIQAGQKVLINGAAGGVGTFAVQLAKNFGAHVTGVCSTRNVELVRSIGADDVIDYTQRDFTTGTQLYDLILDCVGNHSFSECRRVLTPNGRMVGVGAPHDVSITSLIAPMIKQQLQSAFGSQKSVLFVAHASQSDLMFIGDLIAQGKLKPVIDKTYPLSEAADAVRHVEVGHARGKVLISVQ